MGGPKKELMGAVAPTGFIKKNAMAMQLVTLIAEGNCREQRKPSGLRTSHSRGRTGFEPRIHRVNAGTLTTSTNEERKACNQGSGKRDIIPTTVPDGIEQVVHHLLHLFYLTILPVKDPVRSKKTPSKIHAMAFEFKVKDDATSFLDVHFLYPNSATSRHDRTHPPQSPR
ncbi:hypothetical protein QJS10_CPA16g01660 [Acorus calamus]|uniref:Uncharacterized protein n=1 Tax=Acorus calamus TaxID=4465 RepID=A0AAV9D0M7_ACOCL|nr:hypothetical protein QJS10_CPA16g01660 [Acorus calamus]